MTSPQLIHVFGGHRGAHSALSPLRELGHLPTVTVVDPVAGRARRLLDRLRLSGRAVEARAEDALADLEPTALVLAGTDNMATNRRVFETVGSRQVTALQQVLRSVSDDPVLPGVVAGLVAVQAPSRPDPVMLDVFRDLSEIRRGSSADFEDDRVSDQQLAPTRRGIGRATAEVLARPAQALDAATPHALVYRHERYPLVAARGPVGPDARELGEVAAARDRLTVAAVLVRDRMGIDLVIVRGGAARARFAVYRVAPPADAPSRLNLDTLLTD